ncbi:hypothetical protein PVAP13_1KG225200 [Panicum virgatum]|uniref:Uncharacterized protein n=1 Tax=Panicum virgatum TaxID=38727 RepID=A0A8T0XMC5_PANVG|nr:hypothetical protein PVAP13_1KG225200 [Panicum virgatum]
MRPSAVRTLQTWRLEQCSAAAGRRFEEQCGRRSFPGLEEQRRRVDLQAGRRRASGWTFRRGGEEPAGGPSGGEEQSRHGRGKQRSRGSSRRWKGEEQLAPSGKRSFQAASRGRRSRFFSPPYQLDFARAPGRPICFRAGNRARSRRGAKFFAGIGSASASAPPRAPPRRLRSASAPPNRRLAPPSSASRPDCRLPP